MTWNIHKLPSWPIEGGTAESGVSLLDPLPPSDTQTWRNGGETGCLLVTLDQWWPFEFNLPEGLPLNGFFLLCCTNAFLSPASHKHFIPVTFVRAKLHLSTQSPSRLIVILLATLFLLVWSTSFGGAFKLCLAYPPWKGIGRCCEVLDCQLGIVAGIFLVMMPLSDSARQECHGQSAASYGVDNRDLFIPVVYNYTLSHRSRNIIVHPGVMQVSDQWV